MEMRGAYPRPPPFTSGAHQVSLMTEAYDKLVAANVALRAENDLLKTNHLIVQEENARLRAEVTAMWVGYGNLTTGGANVPPRGYANQNTSASEEPPR